MGSTNRRLLAAAALVLAMSAIVGLVVVSPLVWDDAPSPGPAPEALALSDEVAPVIAPPPPQPPSRAEQTVAATRRRQISTVQQDTPAVGAGSIRPLQRPTAAAKPQPVFDTKGKAKGHEKKGLGSKKSGKHGHHAQGAAGKGHGKGKSKDRDRAPARARG